MVSSIARRTLLVGAVALIGCGENSPLSPPVSTIGMKVGTPSAVRMPSAIGVHADGVDYYLDTLTNKYSDSNGYVVSLSDEQMRAMLTTMKDILQMFEEVYYEDPQTCSITNTCLEIMGLPGGSDPIEIPGTPEFDTTTTTLFDTTDLCWNTVRDAVNKAFEYRMQRSSPLKQVVLSAVDEGVGLVIKGGTLFLSEVANYAYTRVNITTSAWLWNTQGCNGRNSSVGPIHLVVAGPSDRLSVV